jgi:two-component system phosphate regulon sensor histidine kinase PhoR
MENGIKYNLPGGSLTVHLSRQEDNAFLRVTDTGMGIPEESIGHIFERFYQGSKRKEGSTGLGLALVDAVCRQSLLQIRYQYVDGWHQFVLYR